MALYGPDSETKLIARDDDSGTGCNAKIAADLSPGMYYVRVEHYNSQSGTGAYSIKGSVKNNLAFLHPDFTISLTDLQSQKSSK
ncbi:MAG: hypothetical protein LWX02_13020 [Deltaproteobacteria bacterium]|jgi:hypothetical protein|nr:hypothetical protein [Deltaproteobacteria bacterium]MDL1987179.1 hypothetical protein [Deltaproteobacteria bacterium]